MAVGRTKIICIFSLSLTHKHARMYIDETKHDYQTTQLPRERGNDQEVGLTSHINRKKPPVVYFYSENREKTKHIV